MPSNHVDAPAPPALPNAFSEHVTAIGFIGGRPNVPALVLGLGACLLIGARFLLTAELESAFVATSWATRLFLFAVVPVAVASAAYGLLVLRSLRTLAASSQGVYLAGSRRERVAAVNSEGTRLAVITEQGPLSLWLAGGGPASERVRGFVLRAGAFLPENPLGALVSATMTTSSVTVVRPLTGSPWGWGVGAIAALGWLLCVALGASAHPGGLFFEMSLGRDIHALLVPTVPSPLFLLTLAMVGGVSIFFAVGLTWAGVPRMPVAELAKVLIVGVETRSSGRRAVRRSLYLYALATTAALLAFLLWAGGPDLLVVGFYYNFIGQAPYVLIWYLSLGRLVLLLSRLRLVEISGLGARIRLDGQWQQATECHLDEDRVVLGGAHPMVWLAFPSCGRQIHEFADALRLAEFIQDGIRGGSAAGVAAKVEGNE